MASDDGLDGVLKTNENKWPDPCDGIAINKTKHVVLRETTKTKQILGSEEAVHLAPPSRTFAIKHAN